MFTALSSLARGVGLASVTYFDVVALAFVITKAEFIALVVHSHKTTYAFAYTRMLAGDVKGLGYVVVSNAVQVWGLRLLLWTKNMWEKLRRIM